MVFMVFFGRRISSFTSHCDLSRKVTAGDRSRDVGDIAHLCGEVAGPFIDAFREILPDAENALDLRLSAQASPRAELARATRVRTLPGEEMGDLPMADNLSKRAPLTTPCSLQPLGLTPECPIGVRPDRRVSEGSAWTRASDRDR
jgi:hypothetical protein